MDTFLIFSTSIAWVFLFAASPSVLLIARQWRDWRRYFQGEVFALSGVMPHLTLYQIWARCALLMLVGAAIIAATKIPILKALDGSQRPFELTWWMTAAGEAIFGLCIWFYLLARRRIPCYRTAGLVVEFLRLTLEVTEVHIQRSTRLHLHFLAPNANGQGAGVLPANMRRNQVVAALDVVLWQTTLAELAKAGTTRVDIYSPLVTDSSLQRLKKVVGTSLHGYAVTYGTVRLRRVESIGLLLMRAVTSWTWLRKRVTLINDKGMLNARIPLKSWYRPAINGFSIFLSPLEKPAQTC